LRDSKIADELVKESVSAILDSTTRGSTIVQQLLTLARKTEPKFDLLNIDAMVEEAAQLFGKSSPQTIEIKLELSRQSPPVLADRNQIFQALLDLCLNARDAMPSGGTLTLKTSLVNRNAVRNAVPGSEEVTAELYVRIDINDTGEGIDEKVLGRIFEPFFTTKGAGRGTGLGLAVVYGILKHHKGSIQVTSKPGAGTSFQIYLPVMRPSD
jgi:two-component system cell cycle sensor histidine kinase/response regulator CckA